jgi:hypothetical protein
MRVSASTDDINHMYVMLSNTAIGPKIVGVHRTKPYSIGMAVNDEWTGRFFGSVGDVHGTPTARGHINIIDFPNDAFLLAGGAGNGGLLHVPTPIVLYAAFAEGLNNIGPFDDNDAGTDIIRTSYNKYVPSKYAHIVLDQRLTPREAWSQWRQLRRSR